MSRLLEGRNKDKMKEMNAKNKEKERVKEREKEARSNKGHLFTSLTVSSTTLCSACNRSITAKEALSCPGCNVTIHNRCRDSLASCAKMKQKQQKLAMARNSSALQNVALRAKTPAMKQRPSSAIYPSDSLRQSLLGSRRVRSGLSLAKSVSTNNIAGVSEDPVGLRRILSQSTESLNFRSRTLSMESLTDDGDWWWSPLLEELQTDGRSVQADSWSLVVEPKFLQTLHKDLIKQQDVIYGNEEEAQALDRALVLLKDLIVSVNKEVLELDRSRRLQEVQARLDPRAQAEVRGGGVFRGGELLRRKLLHEGMLLWRVQGSRMKDVHVLLMSDILVFLQEKDQKFTFASFDKSPVVSLTKLIVRDIANQERGMYLISDSTPPEMYELHASSKDDRRTWMNLIQQASLSCPSREELPLIETEDKALLRRLKADILQKDREVLELLQERVTLFSELAEATGKSGAGEGAPDVGCAPSRLSNNRKLFRADVAHVPLAGPLLAGAICEVDKLSHLLAGCSIIKASLANCNQELSNGEPATLNTSLELNASKDTNGNQLQEAVLKEEVRERLVSVSAQLHALQAAVIRQDSAVELFVRTDATPKPASGPLLSRSMSWDLCLDGGKAALLRRQVELLQDEVKRLRSREEGLSKQEAQSAGRRRSNGDLTDIVKAESARKRRGSRELELHPLAPLATHDPLDQLDGLQEASEDKQDQQVVKISPRSDSPRDLQDIPEESECGAEPS
ncbi:rho guanine nucleotide exchange factor 2-like isoform X3 [Syngnathus typhle]|uniref:rho guanine nucleotide exchange factor 2-like isoform X3 n=1 Tax=Syngnathus typhle TaxID=161592 RepID=UPI002A699DD3|nr:rho guanine nucleotide exchange factor 2-like isoform X3 [Syngnathus typhle]XP_061145582.1 rho guanine nucleotide exchange factor 2-like isoform X3 [Syngnathus typhle]